jgi:hypothetical protein
MRATGFRVQLVTVIDESAAVGETAGLFAEIRRTMGHHDASPKTRMGSPLFRTTSKAAC